MKNEVEMIIAAILLGATSTAAVAQRDPEYQNARTAGVVGEQLNGELGYVTSPSPAVDALVKKINKQRLDKYTAEAAASRVTLALFKQRMGCTLIKQTAPGEKYQAPDKSWQTRTSGAPMLDPECPQ